MTEEQDSLLYEEDICEQRTAGQWIAYKFLTAQSSTLSILGSSVSAILTTCQQYIVLFAIKSDVYSPFYHYCMLL